MNYSQAAKIATKVTIEELSGMLAANDNPRVYRAHRSPVLAMSARLSSFGPSHHVCYDYCDRKGYSRFATAPVRGDINGRSHNFDPPVFEFEAADGTLTLVMPTTK